MKSCESQNCEAPGVHEMISRCCGKRHGFYCDSHMSVWVTILKKVIEEETLVRCESCGHVPSLWRFQHA